MPDVTNSEFDDAVRQDEVCNIDMNTALPPTATVIAAGAVLQRLCHGQSVKSGWWNLVLPDGEVLSVIDLIRAPKDAMDRFVAGAVVAQKLCLTHSEISEGMEGHRKNRMDDKLPHRPMLEVEMADAVIRLFDLAGALDYDLGAAIAEKSAFNAIRPDHKPALRALDGGKAY